MSNFDRREYLGLTWVRTDHMDLALTVMEGDLKGLQNVAADLTVTLAENTGHAITVQPDGWAAVPAGLDHADAADYIDIALEALLGE